MWTLPAQLAALLVLAAHSVIHIRRNIRTKALLQRAQEEAKFAADERRAERAGRIKAEKELRQLQLRLGQLQSSSTPPASLAPQGSEHPHSGGTDSRSAVGSSSDGRLDLQQVAFPLRPIGLLRSCFSRRNGTPRQPLLVPAARAQLTLRQGLTPDFFEGLEQYSHCWVLYIFHENTDLQRLWSERGSGVRGKIRVPRLDGGKMGVFATRSPHRPCPIGLSIAQVVAVEGRTLVLGGADIVDGSPVLDIKPFVPFCDNVPTATAPSWVSAEAENDPLQIGELRLLPEAEEAMKRCWRELGRRSLYRSFEQYRELVAQVLSRDIRSVTQRVKVPQRAQHGGPAALCGDSSSGSSRRHQPLSHSAADQQQQNSSAELEGIEVEEEGNAVEEGFWKVVLDGIQLSYDVEEDSRHVALRSARLATALDS